jgi:hypothetical protein
MRLDVEPPEGYLSNTFAIDWFEELASSPWSDESMNELEFPFIESKKIRYCNTNPINMKKSLLLISACILSFSFTPEKKALISGIITYPTTEHINQPDMGACVYFLDSASAAKLQLEELGKLKHAMMKNEQRALKAREDSIVHRDIDALKKTKTPYEHPYKPFMSKPEMQQLRDAYVASIKKFKILAKASCVSADATGKYVKKINPGTYCMLFESKHSKNGTLFEYDGEVFDQVFHAYHRFKAGEEIKTANFDFGTHD